MNPQSSVSQQIKLYELGIEQIKYYNQIIWQFPTALLTVNIVGLHYFINTPLVLLIIFTLNSSLILAFYRHILNSKSVIKSVQNIESSLREEFPDLIPRFNKVKIKSTTVIFYNMVALNGLLLFTGVYKIFCQ